MLKDAPPLPAGTALYNPDPKWAQRGRLGGYATKPSQYGVFYDNKVVSEGSDKSILVNYDRRPDPSFCGAYIVVVGNLSSFSTMSFLIKGDKGGETFEIGINDTIANKREDAVIVGSIHRYLPKGVTTKWQEVRIPLKDFFGVELSKVYSLVFNFNEPSKGKFWVDRIAFHEEPLVDREKEIAREGALTLDDFNHSDVNLLGRKAGPYKRLPSECKASRVEQPRVGKTGRSLRLDFNKQATGWCGYYTLLNEIDGEFYDLAPFETVTFQVRGLKGGETFEIGMADKSWMTIGDSVKAGPIEKFLPKGVTAGWQQVTIPLAQFGKLDWTQMGSFVINFHRPAQGTVFIDDVRFVRKSGKSNRTEDGRK